ncbi:hypothetical protein ACWOOC_15305 [Citrobacter sp. ESY80]
MTALNKQALRETNSKPVKRIDIGIDEYTWLPIEKACPEGKYVLHSDYLSLLDELEAAEKELSACKNILEKIKSTSCHVDTSNGAFIPNSLDAWGRPVPQSLPYDFSGNPGASATQYCNGWNDAGGYWLNHVKYLQECIRAAGIGVKGE